MFFGAIIATLVISLSGVNGVVWAEPAPSPNGLEFVLAATVAQNNSKNEVPASKGYLGLNNNPQNPSRQPNWEEECVVVLTQNSPEVTLASGTSGKTSTGILPAGIAVVVDRETRATEWVAVCGNDVLAPTDWNPEGKYICAPGQRYENACADTAEILSRLDGIQEGVDDANRKLNLLLERSAPPVTALVPPIVTLAITQDGKSVTRVKKGSSVLVTWSSNHADQCVMISGGEIKPVTPTGKSSTQVNDKRSFTLRCTNKVDATEETREVSPKAKVWPWVVGTAIVVAAIAALSGGGGDDGGGQKEGPTVP